MHEMFQASQKLSDGTYISVTAPGRAMATAALGFLRTLALASRDGVYEVTPPEQRLVGEL